MLRFFFKVYESVFLVFRIFLTGGRLPALSAGSWRLPRPNPGKFITCIYEKKKNVRRFSCSNFATFFEENFADLSRRFSSIFSHVFFLCLCMLFYLQPSVSSQYCCLSFLYNIDHLYFMNLCSLYMWIFWTENFGTACKKTRSSFLSICINLFLVQLI